jgi:K+/H+ antiporter YhaU regulatory subunit KhtT
VTLAVSRSEAETLVRAPSAAVRVRARGTLREFELFSLLRRDGKRLQRIELTEDSPLAGATLGSAGTRETYGVAVLAVRRDRTWTVAPPGTTRLAAGDELYVVGSRDDLDRFAEVGR